MSAQTQTAAVETVVTSSPVLSPEAAADKASAPKPLSPMAKVNALYRQDSALSGESLAMALDLALTARGQAEAADQAGRKAESEVSALTDALTNARNAVREAAASKTEGNVIVARVLYLVTTKDVLGAVSVTAKDVAESWGVSKQYVSQYVAMGRTMHQVGNHSTSTFQTVDKVRRQGAQALRQFAEGAVTAATARARATEAEGEVKVSAEDIANAASVVLPEPAEAKDRTARAEVTVTSLTRDIRRVLDRAKAASKSGTLTGSGEDVQYAIRAAQALAEALRFVTATDA